MRISDWSSDVCSSDLSGGRFELGIGWGSVPEELETFGVGTTEARWRVARLAESLDAMRRLWTGEVVDHAGEHFTLTGAQQRPVPTRHIPVTVGGVGPRTLEIVRTHADWWNVPTPHPDKPQARQTGRASGRARGRPAR